MVKEAGVGVDADEGCLEFRGGESVLFQGYSPSLFAVCPSIADLQTVVKPQGCSP